MKTQKSNKEKVKVIIGFVNNLIITFLVALFGMIGYLFINFLKLDSLKLSLVIFGILALVVLIMIFIGIFFKNLIELED